MFNLLQRKYIINIYKLQYYRKTKKPAHYRVLQKECYKRHRIFYQNKELIKYFTLNLYFNKYNYAKYKF